VHLFLCQLPRGSQQVFNKAIFYSAYLYKNQVFKLAVKAFTAAKIG